MDKQPSMREQIRVYKSTLRGEALAEFNRVMTEQSENKIKKAFVMAKEAAAKAQKKE